MDESSKAIPRARGHLDAASRLDMRADELATMAKHKAVRRELREMADKMRDLAHATRNNLQGAAK